MKSEKLNLPPVKSIVQTGIGYSPLTEKVYLGKQNPKKGMWVGEKKDITNQFLAVLDEYIGAGKVRQVDTLGKGNKPKKSHLFIQVVKNKEGIEKAINFLQKELGQISI